MVAVANAVRWYYYFCPGIWELMFAINRYTAICLPGLHSKMWSAKTLYLMVAIVLAFPFLINGYVWFHHPYCILFEKLITCRHSLIIKLRMSFIINVFLIIVALFVVIVGVFMSHNNVASHALAIVEYKMIIYTVISTFLFTPRYICLLFTLIFPDEKYIFYDLSMLLYFLQHYVPIMLLPVMNDIYRKAFIEFVRLLTFRKNKVITISSTNTK
uniref:Serpentine receptor class gamma n=1 Tax=Panagrellus redivivus TaxID=6233 RepID=A0A7E4ZWI6_PANRE